MGMKFLRVSVLFVCLFLNFFSSSALGMIPPPASRSGILANFPEPFPPPEPSLVTKTVTPRNPLGDNYIASGSQVDVELAIKGLTITSITNVKPVNIVLVADTSSSMNYEDESGRIKLDGAKESMTELVKWAQTQNNLRPEGKKIKIALVEYNSSIPGGARTDFALNSNFGSYAGPTGLYLAIKNLSAEDDTTMGKGLVEASKQFYQDQLNNPNVVNVVIIYSDGVHNLDVDPTADFYIAGGARIKVLDFFRDNRIPIFSIGYGKKDENDWRMNLDGAPPQELSKDILICKNDPDHLVIKTLSNGKTVYYCLVKNGVGGNYNPWPTKIALRLNALAYETGGEYFYSPDASNLKNILLEIAQKIVTRSYAIQIYETFDNDYFSPVLDEIRITKTGEEFERRDSGWDQPYSTNNFYALKTSDGVLEILIPPDAVSGEPEETVYVKFSFIARGRAENDVCIDKSNSRVAWGDITISSDGLGIPSFKDPPAKETLIREYCYRIASEIRGGDVFLENQNLEGKIKVDLLVLGSSFQPGIESNLATLKNYEFKDKSFSNKNVIEKIKELFNYLSKEGGDKFKVINQPELSLDEVEDGILYIYEDSAPLEIKGSIGDKYIGVVSLGADIVMKPPVFNGVAISLKEDEKGGTIYIAPELSAFTLRGSLIANYFDVKGSLYSIESINYLKHILGLAPIIDIIYSYYEPKI